MSQKHRRYSLRSFIYQSRIRLFTLLGVAIVLIVIGLSTWIWQPSNRPYRVRVTGGTPALNRHKVVEFLKRHSQEINLTVDIVSTEGTPEAVRLVQAGEIDLALVNGVLRFPDADQVRQVATLTQERVHLLVKQEQAEAVQTDYAKLNGLTLNVGPADGETALVARSVLKFLRLKPGDGQENTVRLHDWGFDQLFVRLATIESASNTDVDRLRSELPDAIFHSSTLPSPLAERLIRVGRYQLVPLRFASAFAQVTVEEEDLDRDHIDQIHTSNTVIHAFTYGGCPPSPPTDLPTIGSPLILICHADVPNDVISRMLPRIYNGAISRVYNPPALDDIAPTYPLHPASIAFRDRNKPLVRADIAELIQKLLGGIAPLIGGILALYGFYRWRQVLQFLNYYRQLQMLDLMAKGLLVTEELPPSGPDRVRYLEGELAELQRKAVDGFCRNYFYGEGVLENFLALLAETRDFLRRSEIELEPKLEQPNDHAT